MKALHELREMLASEIEEITKKGELTAGSLDTVDKLTHSLKSIDTIIAMSGEGEYSQRMNGGDMGGGYSGYYPRYAYARQRRSSNGRYSRDDGREAMIEKLEDMMEDAPDEKTKSAIQKCISQMERD